MKRILITGASSGIGAATALHLDRRGMEVIAAVREPGEGALASASGRLCQITLDVVGAGGKLATALRPLIPDRLADKLAERT
jgi:NAD(P)-dependent dehydrogenase (short-subunit alcohol dehydrogenase family)